MIRLIKIALTAFVGLMCITYALQNIFNLPAAYWFVETMAGMAGHEAYPGHVGPPVTAAPIIWAILWIIILSELAAGAASFKGMMDLWSSRNADAATFNAAKKWGIVGAGLGVIVWFGYFHGIGGAYFQMWQTEAGANALMGAFQYAMMCGLVALLLMQKDD